MRERAVRWVGDWVCPGVGVDVEGMGRGFGIGVGWVVGVVELERAVVLGEADVVVVMVAGGAKGRVGGVVADGAVWAMPMATSTSKAGTCGPVCAVVSGPDASTVLERVGPPDPATASSNERLGGLGATLGGARRPTSRSHSTAARAAAVFAAFFVVHGADVSPPKMSPGASERATLYANWAPRACSV